MNEDEKLKNDEGAGSAADNNAVTPPPYDDDDFKKDAELLRTIGRHPEAAQFLAELAAGGDEAELLKSHFPQYFGDCETTETSDSKADEPMFRNTPSESAGDSLLESCPTFLADLRPGFWD